MDRISRALRRNFGFPIGTLAIVFLSTYFFFHFAGGAFFSPDFSVVASFGLDHSNPLTFLTYTFVHLWVLHLLANMSFVFVFGSILEKRFGLGEFLCLYFLGSALAGLFAQGAGMIFDQKVYLIVGASGAAFVLLGAAFVARPVQSLLAYLVLSYFIVPVILSANIDDLRDRSESGLAQQVETISIEQQRTLESFQSGEMDQDTFTSTSKALETEKNQTLTNIKGISQAKMVERVTPIAETTHINAVFLGALICLMFRPEFLMEWAARARSISSYI